MLMLMLPMSKMTPLRLVLVRCFGLGGQEGTSQPGGWDVRGFPERDRWILQGRRRLRS